MSKSSEKALDAGAMAVVAMWDDPTPDILVMVREEVNCAFEAAHAPALGKDASVRLGDVLDHATCFPELEEDVLRRLGEWLLDRHRKGIL